MRREVAGRKAVTRGAAAERAARRNDAERDMSELCRSEERSVAVVHNWDGLVRKLMVVDQGTRRR